MCKRVYLHHLCTNQSLIFTKPLYIFVYFTLKFEILAKIFGFLISGGDVYLAPESKRHKWGYISPTSEYTHCVFVKNFEK